INLKAIAALAKKLL
nr:mastoparan M [Vespa mandarinia]